MKMEPASSADRDMARKLNDLMMEARVALPRINVDPNTASGNTDVRDAGISIKQKGGKVTVKLLTEVSRSFKL